jgi:hypothetical protein
MDAKGLGVDSAMNFPLPRGDGLKVRVCSGWVGLFPVLAVLMMRFWGDRQRIVRIIRHGDVLFVFGVSSPPLTLRRPQFRCWINSKFLHGKCTYAALINYY